MRKLVSFTCLLFTLATIGVYAQSVDLNTAIKNGAAYFEQNLQSSSTVAVLSIRSDSLTLSEYVIDELSSYLVNGKTFTVVDRANIDLIQREMNYQLSGDVSDETAQSIGKRIGAETVITGAFQPIGDEYRLDLRALSVETGVIQGVTRQNIRPDNVLASLIEGVVALPSSESWKNNWLYLGLRVGYGFFPTSFDVSGSTTSNYNFNTAFSVTGQITEWFGIQVEIMYSLFSIDIQTDSRWFDEATYGHGTGTETDSSLMLPLLARFTFRPGNFSFGAIGGVYFSFPLGTGELFSTLPSGSWRATSTPKNSGVGIMLGGNFGYHIGPGSLFLDIRAFLDITKNEIVTSTYVNGRHLYDREDWYQRGAFNFSIGYEIGLIPKARK